jgi:hypothetical protein
MSYNHSTTDEFTSNLFPEVKIILRKMTEKRRLELRKLISEPNRRIRDIFREQAQLEKEPEATRDFAKILELSDEYEQLMLEKVNPSWITWGTKQIIGLEVEGKPLAVEDWADWPSALFDEVLTAIKAEAELGSTARKNFASDTISGELADQSQKPTIVPSVERRGGGGTEIAPSITLAG